MAVVGASTADSTGDHQAIYAKSVLDGTTAILFTASCGPGVGLSSACLRESGAIAPVGGISGSTPPVT